MNPKNQVSNTAKKPLYKRWWFWVIIVLVLGTIAAINQPEDNDETSTDATVVSENSNDENKATENTSTNATNEEASPTTQTEGSSSSENAGGYKVGETMVFKDRKVTVTGIERNFSTGNTYVVPEDGKEFVKVDITVTNTSTSNIHAHASDWKMQDGSGVIDGYDLYATSATKNALNMPVELAGGGQVSGSLVFEVPKDDSALQLQYKASFLNTVVIKL